MPRPPTSRRLALPLIHPGEALTGAAPAPIERALRTCRAGDRVHRGLVHVAVATCRHGVESATPPGARGELLRALTTASEWASDLASAEATRKARSDAYNAAVAVERLTVDAVGEALAIEQRKERTELDEHADRVVLRYAGLGAHFVCGAVTMTLDGVATPESLVGVGQQVAGALAYNAVGLGPARSSRLRADAWSQAEWEAERRGDDAGHSAGALAVQILHEYLGAAWRDRSDARRLYLGDFAEWALGAERSN